MARALITGITGQDGSYLTELLLEKGYEVHGLVRSNTVLERSWLGPLLRKPELANRLFFHGYKIVFCCIANTAGISIGQLLK